MEFSGRVALITGAGNGLGAAYARFLAARGAKLVVNNRRRAGQPSSAQAMVGAILAAGGEAVADEHAVETASSGRAMVDLAYDSFGRLDIIIANAGVADRQSIEDCDLDGYQRTMQTNFLGSIAPIIAALPRMREQDYGRLILTTSSTALFGATGLTAYAASKMALVGFARALSVELRKTNIRINTISPYARTNMSRDLLSDKFETLMAPERVAPIVAWLASEACDRSGIILSAGAGRVRRVLIAESALSEIGNEGAVDWSVLDDLARATETRDSRWSSTALVPELIER